MEVLVALLVWTTLMPAMGKSPTIRFGDGFIHSRRRVALINFLVKWRLTTCLVQASTYKHCFISNVIKNCFFFLYLGVALPGQWHWYATSQVQNNYNHHPLLDSKISRVSLVFSYSGELLGNHGVFPSDVVSNA